MTKPANIWAYGSHSYSNHHTYLKSFEKPTLKSVMKKIYIDINWKYYLTFYSPCLVASTIRLGWQIKVEHIRWDERCGTGTGNNTGRHLRLWVHKAGVDPPFFPTNEPGARVIHVLLVENNLLICGISRNHWAPRWVLTKLTHSSDATNGAQLSFHYFV